MARFGRRQLAVAAALLGLLTISAVPVAADTGGGGGSGATVAITGAHLFAKVGVVVDVAVTCQPLNGVTQLQLGYGPGNSGLSVNITERVGKTVAGGSGSFNGSNIAITCDGTTVSQYQITVLPSGSVPFSRGAAAMDATAFIIDPNSCCGPGDSGDSGWVTVKVTS